MGGIFGRRKTNPAYPNDPFYQPGPYGVPPTGLPGSYPYQPGYDPSGGLGGYDPNEPYGYGYGYGDTYDPLLTSYGAGMGRGYYGGRYGRGKLKGYE
jgi:hypothetical protein